MRSYETSPEHIKVLHNDRRWGDCPSGGCVFRKTDFVKKKLLAIDQEATRLTEQHRLTEEDQRASENLETLRKSRFDTFVYVMEDSRNGTFKIGQSKTPGKRERTLQSETPEITLRFSIPTDEAHEKHLHAQFDSKRIRGEWFSLTPDDLLQIVQFLKTNGDVPRVFVDHEWLGSVYFRSGPDRPTFVR